MPLPAEAVPNAILLLLELNREEAQPAHSHAEFPGSIPRRSLLIPLTWLDFNQHRNTLPTQVVLILLLGCSRGSQLFWCFTCVL